MYVCMYVYLSVYLFASLAVVCCFVLVSQVFQDVFWLLLSIPETLTDMTTFVFQVDSEEEFNTGPPFECEFPACDAVCHLCLLCFTYLSTLIKLINHISVF